jgi:O-antigen ligase
MTLGSALPDRAHQGAQACLVLTFLAFPLSLALANLAMLLMLLLWLLSLFGKKARGTLQEALRNPLAIPALALFMWVLVAITWSPAPPDGVLGFLQKYLKFAMVPIFIALLQDGGVRRRCWQAFAAAMLFTLVVTWLNVWFDFPWTRTHNQGFGRDHTVVKDYISQGLMMTVFTAVCVFVALGQPTRARRTGMWLLWALASASILLLLQGRTGYLAWAASTSVLALCIALAQSRRAVAATTLGLTVVFTLAVFSSPVLQQRWERAWDEAEDAGSGPVTSVGSRIEMASFALQQASLAPLAGHGTASYPVLAPQHFTDDARCKVVCTHPHNQFLFFLFEQGTIGLLLFLWFLGAIVREGWGQAPRRRAFVLAFATTAVVASSTHSAFFLSTESHCLILMSALIMAGLRARRTVGEQT